MADLFYDGAVIHSYRRDPIHAEIRLLHGKHTIAIKHGLLSLSDAFGWLATNQPHIKPENIKVINHRK